MLTEGVVIYGREDFRYEAFEIPDLGQEEVLVAIESCGICAADPKIYYGNAYFSQVAYNNAPIVAGHEFMGRVIGLGQGAGSKYGLKIGDRAVAENIVPCGECYWCRHGQYNLCDPHAVFGIVKHNGGWARHMVYPKGSIVHKVPDSIAWADAAIVEPLACALHGVNRARIQFGETVVVMGCGAIGLLMLQGAKLKNPRQVIAVDLNDHRLDVARDLGADITINPLHEDALERVRSVTEDGIGCDVVLEVAGSNKSVKSGIDMLRRGGRLMEFAVFAEEVSFDWSIISDIKELEIIGGHLGYNTYAPAIDFLARGLITSRGIASEPFVLTDFKHAIDVSKKADRGAIKVLIRPE
ncbi:MAG: alcohol dehydrogenase catalytic domain-containing protein [Anaerolineae bacterium]